MKKGNLRLVSLFLCCVFILNFCLPLGVVQGEPLPQRAIFTDIKGHWAEKVINKWLSLSLVGGYTDGTFKPDHSITRAEFVALVNRAFEYMQSTTFDFTDVLAQDWYASDVAKAVAAGYINGYPDGTFQPNQAISRQEVAAALTKSLSLQGGSAESLYKYQDQAEIPLWSLAAINAISKNGYMSGYPDGTFRPTRALTRAEAISVLDRVLGLLYEDAPTNEEVAIGFESEAPRTANDGIGNDGIGAEGTLKATVMEPVGVSWTVGSATTMDRLGVGVDKDAGVNFDLIYPWSEMKLCNVADDGAINAYIGDDNFKRDGTNGQVMVKIPKFYYKRTYDGKKHEFWVAGRPAEGFKLHPCFIREGKEIPYVLMGAYPASEGEGGKLTSISGKLPAVSRTRADFRDQAHNRGKGWEIADALSRYAVSLLYLVEYADTNSQTAIGRGFVDVVGGPIASGGCDSLAGESGIADGVDGKVSVSYRGLEDLWGNAVEFIDGINIKNREKQPYIADSNFADNKFDGNYVATGITLPAGGGFCQDFAVSAETDWLLIPSSSGGSSSTYIPDYYFQNWNWEVDKVALVGGICENSDHAGLFYWSVIGDSSDASIFTGARLLQIP